MKFWCFIFCFSYSILAYSQSEKIEALTKEGLALHDKGDYLGAIDKYKQVLVYDRNSDLMNYEIAFSYAQEKNYVKAIEHCNIVLAGKGQSQVLAVVLKGTCLDELGQTKVADKLYKQALHQYPKQYLLLLNYGIRCRKKSLPLLAEKYFLEAIDAKPDYAASHLNLAYLKFNDGERLKGILGLYFFLMLENNTPRSQEAYQRLLDNLDIITHTAKADSSRININIAFPVSHAKLSRTDLGEVSLYLITILSAELNKANSPVGQLAFDTDKIFTILGQLQAQGTGTTEDFWWRMYIPFFFQLKTAGHSEAFVYEIANAGNDLTAIAWKKNNADKSAALAVWLKQQ